VLRGEVYKLKSWPLSLGHEQQGERYAIIVQSDSLPILSTVVVIPTSTKVRETTFHIPIADLDGDPTFALCEQVCAIDYNKRLGAFSGFVDYDELLAIDRALRLVQDL
jgi:mRNA interferase MazF